MTYHPRQFTRIFATAQDQRGSANYRADIDGLRAIAVMAVLVFHLDFKFLSGGFIGVDIFFVISGYLIGKSILDQRRAGTFKLTDFYQKRLRRIMPALVTVFSVTTIAALIVLLPVPLVEYGSSLLAANYSIANIYFWFQSDYFDAAAHTKPLLHTWSLGVEEQFYILFPLLLLVTRRANARWLIAAVCIISFVGSVYIQNTYSSANFYLIPTRAWELMFGVIAAELHLPLMRRRLIREIVAALSLLVLLICGLLYTQATVFPGLMALPPVLATAILLNSGAQGPSLSKTLLTLRPVVWIGLLSYSLYLWHWPVIVMIKAGLPEAWLRMPHRIIALTLSFGLAWLSWRFIERPFRSPRMTNRIIWTFSGTAALGFTLVAAALVLSHGLPGRFTPQVVRTAELLDNARARPNNPCEIGLYAPPGSFTPDACLKRAADRPNVLIMGDSHADHLRSGLLKRFPQIAFQQATAAGCRTTLKGFAGETRTCAAYRKKLYEWLKMDPPRWVLLSLFWGGDPEPDVLIPTIRFLQAQGIKVIIAGPLPRYEVALPQALALAEVRGDPAILAHARIPGTAEADMRFARIVTAQKALYMSAYAAMCPQHDCMTRSGDGVPLQFDSHHLTAAGSLLATAQFPFKAVMQDWQQHLRAQTPD